MVSLRNVYDESEFVTHLYGFKVSPIHADAVKLLMKMECGSDGYDAHSDRGDIVFRTWCDKGHAGRIKELLQSGGIKCEVEEIRYGEL